jgi:hypothetical protein
MTSGFQACPGNSVMSGFAALNAFSFHTFQVLARKPCRGGLGIVILHLCKGGSCLIPELQAVVAVTDFQQRVRHFPRLRIPLNAGLTRL